jgi:hypothetical protein
VKHKKITVFTLICTVTAFCIHAEKKVITLIKPRSASVNAALELVGLDRQIYVPHHEGEFYAVATVTPEIIKTFRPERIAQCLFGDDILLCPRNHQGNCPEKRGCQNVFLVSGSQVPDRVDNAWLADYFGLPTDFESAVLIKPRVHSIATDLYLYCGLDNLCPGLYFTIHAPIVHTSWNLDICEKIDNAGENPYTPGYFNATGVKRDKLAPSFLSFISGCRTPEIDGITFHPLKCAKMSPHRLELTRFSEVQTELGYNFFYSRCYHLGVDLRMSIPTGNSPRGEFLFEPLVGNGNHWQVGAGLTGHVVAWEDTRTEESFAIHSIINITHLFNARQKRIFDLKNKPLSRYMLAAQVDDTITNNLRGTVDGIPTVPSFQFSNEYTPVANLTTRNVDTNINAQVDMLIMFTYAKERFSWNIGYGFWAQTCENVALACNDPCAPTGTWVLKGDAHTFGFMGADDAPLRAGSPVAFSASEQEATLHAGTNINATYPDFIAAAKNPTIDNPEPATAGPNNTRLLYAPNIQNTQNNQINTSIDPIILTPDMIDICSTQSRAIAQKLFMHVHYTVTDCEYIVPHFGFGAEVDFGRSAGFPPPKECRKCINAALSYWGVWLKAGITFE